MLGPECRAKSLKTIVSCHSGLILVLEESESHSYVCSCVETDEGLVANLGCHGDTSRRRSPGTASFTLACGHIYVAFS